MASILDPPIWEKVAKMKERVRWGHPAIAQRQIDQTRLYLDDGQGCDRTFSFLVIGDSGSGPHTDHHPQRRIAEQMVPHLNDCRFLLHTGDVVYQVGSREQYPDNFIKPYREWLVGGEQPETLSYDQMVFKVPFLPVPGNHDYYNLPWAYSLLVQLTRPLSKALRMKLNPNVGWHGSGVGDAYAHAFLDYLKGIPNGQLTQHLETHYPDRGAGPRGLHYQLGQFTRVPNRYYRFTYGGIDFFALDATTFNAPSPLPRSRDGERYRRLLIAQREVASAQKLQVMAEADALQASDPHATERLDDLQAKVEQLEEVLLDINKQISATSLTAVDAEQLWWLRRELIASWQNPAVRGRVLYFHYPPYVSETTKVYQGQTLAVRHHLRWVLDEVATALNIHRERPLVDLVLNGHAHCLEYLRTGDTGHADSYMNWVVCGGSGLSLRRQQPEGAEIYETFPSEGVKTGERRLVAKSQLYLGLTGHKTERRRPYSFLRVDVSGDDVPQFTVRPYVSERYHQQWHDYALEPLVL